MNQILETWFINHRINLLLIDSLNEEALNLTTSKRGGGNVGHQLAHIYNVRYWKLESMNKNYVKGMVTIKSEDEKTIESLKNIHILSANLVGKVLEEGIENDYQIKGFKRGVVPLLGYLISHDSHHRGNILLTLKLCNFKLSDKVKYGLWEWNKI